MCLLGDMFCIVIILEVLGMILLVVVYFSINDYLLLSGVIGILIVVIIMIFVGIGLMILVVVCIVWCVVCGFGLFLGSVDRIFRF